MRNDIIYLLEAKVPGAWGLPKTVQKIGITDRRPEARVREIRESGGPACRVVAWTKRGNARDEETKFHRRYAGQRWRFRRKFNGSTEFFALTGSQRREVLSFMGGGGFDFDWFQQLCAWAILAVTAYELVF